MRAQRQEFIAEAQELTKQVVGQTTTDNAEELAALRVQRQEFADEAKELTEITREVLMDMTAAIEAFASGIRTLGETVADKSAHDGATAFGMRRDADV